MKNKQQAKIIDISKIQKTDYKRISTQIAEFDRCLGGGVVNGSLVLVSGDPGIGKCVAGSTRILNPVSGEFLPITAWKKTLRPVLALNNKINRLSPQSVLAFHNQGIRPIVELKTRLGRTLRCTINHPVLTSRGWYPVGELSIGTRIATPRGLPFFGKKLMAKHKVKLIAYILSDGSAQSSISVTAALPEIADDLEDVANKFGMVLRVYNKKHNLAKQYRFVLPLGQRAKAREKIKKALWRARNKMGISWQAWALAAQVNYSKLNTWRRGKAAPSRDELRRLAKALNIPIDILASEARNRAEMTPPTARFLSSIGLRMVTAKNKSVPDCVFCLPKHQLALFLKVLFSCDGSVYVTNNSIPALSYSTISYRLAQDIQHLLLRFNFIAKLRTKSQQINRSHYQSYELQILGLASVQRFLHEIGIWGRERAKAKIKTLSLPALPSTQFDTIPTGPIFWEHLQEATGGISLRLVSKQAGVTIRNRRQDRPLTRTIVAAISRAYPSPYLESLSLGDVYWDEIESMTPVGEERVYDLTIPGVANFVANDLIIHNSTLLTHLALNINQSSDSDSCVLYIAGEESAKQIKIRIDRITRLPSGEKLNAKLAVLNEVDVDAIIDQILQFKPSLVIVDSIQTLETSDLESVAGSVGQVRECTHRLQRLAKDFHIPIFLVGHVTKEGSIAGPKTLEHVVDVVLSLEGDPISLFRILRATKNRFGPTDEIGVFEMVEAGMVEVTNPSKVFLNTKQNAPGSAVVAIQSGIRPLLLEIQALVAKSGLPIPRRVGNGIDNNRLQLLAAVLQKRLGLVLFDADIYVNVTGGLRISEPASDLGVCVAIVSSLKDIPIKEKTVLIGEVGLLGELRAVRQIDKRIKEARKLGFSNVISFKNAKNLSEAIRLALVDNL